MRLLHVAPLALAVAATAAGCGQHPATTDDARPRSGHSSTELATIVTLREEGGFAALSRVSTVRAEPPSFSTVTRRLCAPSAQCTALDSAMGPLGGQALREVLALASADSVLALRPDYGRTRNAADMMDYTLEITIGGTTRTVHGDDGTQPGPMRAVAAAVHRAIEDARRPER